MTLLSTSLVATLALTAGPATPPAQAEQRTLPLTRTVTLRTHRISGSQVRVAKAPLRMLEVLPGCPGYPCGRQTAMLPSVRGARAGAQVAIGGGFVRDGRPVHDYVHNGRVRSRGLRSGDIFRLDEDGTATIQRGRDRLLRGAEELVGGYPQVLDAGAVPQDRGDCKNDDGPDGAFCLRQPRQGIGLSRDGKTVILLEVDGHQGSWSKGVLLPQLGRLFKRFGAYDAVNLDGGGSAVMWTRNRTRACQFKERVGCLVSRPSYRSENPPHGERRVAQTVALVP